MSGPVVPVVPNHSPKSSGSVVPSGSRTLPDHEWFSGSPLIGGTTHVVQSSATPTEWNQDHHLGKPIRRTAPSRRTTWSARDRGIRGLVFPAAFRPATAPTVSAPVDGSKTFSEVR